MRYPAGQKLEVCSQAYDSLLALEQDRDKRAKYLQFIDFYAGLNDNELNQMQLKYLKDKPNMAGFAQHFRQEGREVKRGFVGGSGELGGKCTRCRNT